MVTNNALVIAGEQGLVGFAVVFVQSVVGFRKYTAVEDTLDSRVPVH